MEQVFALHGLFQQGPVLQHQGLDLVQKMAVLLLEVPLQLAQKLHTEHGTSAHGSFDDNRKSTQTDFTRPTND